MNEAITDNYQEQLRQQTTLARFGELALKSDDLDEILTEACHLVGEAMGTDLAKVVELQADGRTLLVRAGVGWQPGVVGVATVTAADDTSEGVALKTGEPMVSPDIAKETRFRYPPFLIDNGVRAVVNVLIIGGKDRPPFGILQVDSREPRQFTDSDTAFLRSYANLLAAAVDRVRVIGEAREQNARRRVALETRVAERTGELTTANARLRAEAAERERVEEVLRQSLKMEAVGQLTGGLAHDFNNMLAGISGSLELVRIRIAQGRAPEIGRYIDTAMSSIERATALTHRLLAFSRRQTLDPKPTDMNRLVGNMEDLVRRSVGPGIQVEFKPAAALWPTFCDPNQLENALLNLVLNARDAMQDGGHLRIETANAVLPGAGAAGTSVSAGALPAGEYVVLLVTDTGTGMSAHVIQHAFDPFYTTKPTGEGTGLGLSMIHGFVQQSGGYVLLRSENGQGTTVTIYLPRYLGAADDEAKSQAAAEPPAAASAVVLMIEDEAAVRMVIREVLTDSGYRVLETDNGQSGLHILESGVHIDLLLTDVGLPGGMNGRQVADLARERRPDLKVLFLTGYVANAAVGSGQMAPGMEVMTKPFALDALLARIRTMIGD